MATKAFQKIYTQLEAITKATVALRAQGISNDELAVVDGRLAQVVKTKGDLVTLQVFAGTEGIPTNAEVTFLGAPPTLKVSDELAGRFFDAYGKPLDGGPEVEGREVQIGGPSVNPYKRRQPSQIIPTGLAGREVCHVAQAKKVKKVVNLQIQAGKANPAPPVGPALGQAGVNIQQFCTQFNDKTKDMIGYVIPVVITVYEDRSFTFITKTPPASDLLKKAANIKSGSSNPKKTKVATISRAQLLEIAKTKMPDLNAYDVEAASRIVEGTARNMGIVVED